MDSKRRNTFSGGVMTVTEVADYLRIHRSTVYRLLKDNRIPAFRVGSDWRFSRDAIDEWQQQASAAFVAENRLRH
jgi:excisionase family DNA binding protein